MKTSLWDITDKRHYTSKGQADIVKATDSSMAMVKISL